MDDTEQNQHKFLKFQIMNPYSIHSMTQEFPTHSLYLMASPSMIKINRSAVRRTSERASGNNSTSGCVL